ncbi:MAG: putative porin [Leptospiraceae bacterium]|nr:putative porin [Leptospiraceae bacterium]
MPLAAEWQWGLYGTAVHGKHILETGSKTRDANGFAGGSRLTYPRYFSAPGVRGRYSTHNWLVDLNYQLTNGSQRSGTARNEDFALYENSTIRSSGWDLRTGRYRDTPYTINGSRNFADASGKSDLQYQDLEVNIDWYPWQSDDAPQSGFFLGTGLHYSYQKYQVYDVIQYLRLVNGFFLGPIGVGNSFSSVEWEFPLGFGYQWHLEQLYIKAALYMNTGINTGRDHHKQRNITFLIQDASGSGIQYNLELGYQMDAESPYTLFARYQGRHYYSRGTIQIRGGLGGEYLLQYTGIRQGVRISRKETMLSSGFLFSIP